MVDLFFVLIVLAHRRGLECFTLRDAFVVSAHLEVHTLFGGPSQLWRITYTWRKYTLSGAERHLRPAFDTGPDQAGLSQERGRIA